MTVVRELITKLSFRVDNSKFVAYQASIAKAEAQQKKLNKSIIGWTPTGSMINTPIAKPAKSNFFGLANKSSESLGAKTSSNTSKLSENATQARMQKILAYNQELEAMSVLERKEIKALNAAEKQAMREITAEQKAKFRNEKELLRQRQVAVKKSVAGLKSSFSGLNTMANRFLGGLTLAAGGVFAKTMSDYKKYKDELKSGKTKTVFFSKEQLIKLTLFNNEFTKFKRNSSDITHQLFSSFSPALTDILKKFNEWYNLNKKEINEKIEKYVREIADAFVEVWRVLNKVYDLLRPLFGDFLNLKNILLSVIGIKVAGWALRITGAMWNFGVAIRGVGILAAAKFPAIGTAISSLSLLGVAKFGLLGAAAYLLYDEIKVTMEGGDSMIQRFTDSTIANLQKAGDAIIDYLGIRKSIESIREHTQARAEAGKARDSFWETKKVSDTQRMIDSSLKQNVSAAMKPYITPDFAAYGRNAAVNSTTNTNKSIMLKQDVGDIKITINNTGNLDEKTIKDVSIMFKKQFTQQLSDVLTLSSVNQLI